MNLSLPTNKNLKPMYTWSLKSQNLTAMSLNSEPALDAIKNTVIQSINT